MIQCKFLANTKKESRLFIEHCQLFLESADFALIINSDTLNQKPFNFVFLEEYAHYQVVDIFIFDEFTQLQLSELLQSIDFSDYWYHKLHKYGCLVDYWREFVFREGSDVLIKCFVDGS